MGKKWFSLLLVGLLTLPLLLGCGSGGASDVDIDLSRMNPNMRYAEITQVSQDPAKYVGKTARLVGYFRPYPDGDKNGTYTTGRIALEMPDQAGCCAAVVEFVLKDPEGTKLPAVGTEVTVVGVLETYTQDGIVRCQFTDATMKKSSH
ncbi:MAG: hypothetical protein IKG32_07580 [Clostridia bacterium]|nr:hypothetical protein [Clostridia bacterium]